MLPPGFLVTPTIVRCFALRVIFVCMCVFISRLIFAKATKVWLILHVVFIRKVLSYVHINQVQFLSPQQVLYSSLPELWRSWKEILEEPHFCITHIWCWCQWQPLWWGRWLFFLFQSVFLSLTLSSSINVGSSVTLFTFHVKSVLQLFFTVTQLWSLFLIS